MSQSSDCLQDYRLSGAILANKDENFVFLDLQGKVVDNVVFVVHNCNSFELQQSLFFFLIIKHTLSKSMVYL